MKRQLPRQIQVGLILCLLLIGFVGRADGIADQAAMLVQRYGDWVQGRGKPPPVPPARLQIGQDPEVVPGPAQELYTCKIEVLDDATGKPIEGATITASVGREIQGASTKSVTDAGGFFVLRRLKQVPEPSSAGANSAEAQMMRGQNFLVLDVAHTNYSGAAASWYSTGGPEVLVLPTNYQFRLIRGITIGGRVLNPEGKPAARAQVSAGVNYEQNPTGVQRNTFRSPETGIFTDGDGRWQLTHCPSNAIPPFFHVQDAEGAEGIFQLREQPAMYGGPMDRSVPAAVDGVLAGTGEFRLPEGTVVQGRVVDGAGNPVAGATVFEWHGCQPMRQGIRSTTDREGRFVRRHRQAKEWLYSAIAPGYGTASVVASVKAGMPEVRIVLPPATPLRVRWLDEAGKPVKGATVALLPEFEVMDQNPASDPAGLVWCDQTDADGRLVWSNAPASAKFYTLYDGSGRPQSRKWRGGGPEQKLVGTIADKPNAATRVAVRILDGKTRKPLTSVEVLSRPMPHLAWSPLFSTNVAEFVLSIPASPYPASSAQIRVAGYAPQTVEANGDATDGVQEILMIADTPQKVQLLDPTGQPVPKATAWICPDSQPHHRVFISRFQDQKPQVFGQELVQVKADAEGVIRLSITDPELRLAIIGDELMWSGKIGRLAGKTNLVLSPFGRVEGRLLAGGQPVANTRVSVNIGTALDPESIVSGSIYSTTKADGSFSLGHIPPGAHQLQRVVDPRNRPGTIQLSHSLPVKVGADETVKLDYTFKGINLAGSLECDGELPDDWSECEVFVQGMEDATPATGLRRFINDFVSMRRFVATGAGMQSGEPPNAFRGFVQDDGSFTILDVPPGNYTLHALVHKAGKGPRRDWEPLPVTGQLERRVTVGAASGVMDLGVITVKTAGPAENPGVTATRSLAAFSEDGKKVTLPPGPGKPRIVVFWSTWSERSLVRLHETQEWLGKSKVEAELIGINVDEEPAVAGQFARAKNLPGRHLAWGDSLRAEALAQWGVETIPSLWVIDSQGKAVREPSVKRMAALISTPQSK